MTTILNVISLCSGNTGSQAYNKVAETDIYYARKRKRIYYWHGLLLGNCDCQVVLVSYDNRIRGFPTFLESGPGAC